MIKGRPGRQIMLFTDDGVYSNVEQVWDAQKVDLSKLGDEPTLKIEY